jgi:inner membrane protein
MPALLIGANLPDIDIISYAWGGLAALEFRRGLTHGPIGLVLLPWLLTAAFRFYHRLRFSSDTSEPPPAWGRLLLLSYLATLTHPLLDWCNTYGIRWLAPFSERWWYGDALFIVDPWVWVILSAGTVLSRAKAKTGRWWKTPATWSLYLFAAYAVAMGWISRWGRNAAVEAAAVASGERPHRVMASPVPLNPFQRLVVLEETERYRFGRFDLLPRASFVMESYAVDKNRSHVLAELASNTPQGRAFLSWARFPFYVVRSDRPMVYLVDARYSVDPEATFGAVAIVLPDLPTAPGARPSP